jgi:hypothetical protein
MRGESGRTGGAREARRRVARAACRCAMWTGCLGRRAAWRVARGAREQDTCGVRDQRRMISCNQQPQVYSSRSGNCTYDNKTLPESLVFPATRTRWILAMSIGSHVQNTGFSGGSIIDPPEKATFIRPSWDVCDPGNYVKLAVGGSARTIVIRRPQTVTCPLRRGAHARTCVCHRIGSSGMQHGY